MHFGEIIKTMAKRNTTKLTSLLASFPRGTVQTAAFLVKKGYTPMLLKKYISAGWIDPVGRGAYIMHGDTVKWTGGFYAVQSQLGLDIHVGARTALELQGYGHYLSGGLRRIFLFGLPGVRLPKWFTDHDWGEKVEYVTTKMLPISAANSFSLYEEKGYTIRLSSPERAIMEVLYLVPERQGFDEALRLMEGLTTLRPALVQSLLEGCTSVKIKRLFLYLAEKSGHSWMRDLDLSRINLGRGKRVIEKGGKFVAKYGITVPANVVEEPV
jgi:hypothetical protein